MPSRVAALLPALALLLGCGASAGHANELPAGERRAAAPVAGSVLVITLDGFNPAALARTGPSGTPTLHRLVAEGASTLNARTEYELTLTLPNHTGMVTGRRIDAATGGHGVTWNDERRRPRTVQAAAGVPVSSVFEVVDDAGLSSALFASKTKFSLWTRSWPGAIDHDEIIEDNQQLTRAARTDLGTASRAFRFLHLSQTDVVGHAQGFMGKPYLRAVRRSDRLVGTIIKKIEQTPALAATTTVIVTADHGGRGASHTSPAKLANYRVPFIVWGAGVEAGADLYAINPTYTDPGTGRAPYGGSSVAIRNGMVADLALDLLGLPPVPGSELDAAQDLEVSTLPVAG